MNVLQAAEQILTEVGEPLHVRIITEHILQQQLWTTSGATPEATVNAALAVDIKEHSIASRFQRTDKGVFALRRWCLPEYTQAFHSDDSVVNHTQPGQTLSSKPPLASPHTRSFTDAAQDILEQYGQQQPMHYREITRKALQLGLLDTQGKTPEATMYAQILSEIARQGRRGELPRFVKHGKGKISLAHWHEQPRDVVALIKKHNHDVRQQLHNSLHTMDPIVFEELVGELLAAIGFEEVTVTKPSGDGGIDVRGTLVVGDVIRLHMAVQVKRWKQNIHTPTVQQVRGSLGTHDQGLIITTSNFSEGAKQEAGRRDAVPVALMNGEQLVSLLVEHTLGVHRTVYNLIELGEDGEN